MSAIAQDQSRQLRATLATLAPADGTRRDSQVLADVL
jgi:hypothetical protein